MKAVYINEFGGAENLCVREIHDPPRPEGTQVLVRVHAAGLNRADLLQRRGLYPPPPGFSPNIPGLEFAGEVIETGALVRERRAGDRVFGVTAGEAQAEMLLIDESLTAKIPQNLNFTEAAAVPEAFITAHDAIFKLGGLKTGQELLIHAVGSGVGLAALQLAKARDICVFGTSRTAEKLERCREFGLDEAINTIEEPDFSVAVIEKTGGRGVNAILDLVGGAYFAQNLRSLSMKGRLLLVGLTGGSRAEFDMGLALSKRLNIIGTVLRSRSITEKAAAVRGFCGDVVPLFETGVLKPNLDRVFPIEEMRAAHEYLESNTNFGKVVLEVMPNNA